MRMEVNESNLAKLQRMRSEHSRNIPPAYRRMFVRGINRYISQMERVLGELPPNAIDQRGTTGEDVNVN